MSYDLNSSSSSDLDADIAPRRIVREEASSGSEDSGKHAIDEELIESIRNALHLSVGNICREQDAANKTSGDEDDDMNMGIDAPPSFTVSNAAIAALTDLTYHYSTTLLANDLVAFSSHAGRKIIKPEDVLLMSRKDKNGISADMKRKMKEIQARTTNEKGSRSKKKKSVSPNRRKSSNSDRSKSPIAGKKTSDRSKSPNIRKKAAGKKTKVTKSSKRRKERPKATVYSSSSSSSDDEKAMMASVLQKAAEIERNKNRDNGSLDDFIVDDNNYYDSDGEVDFQLSAKNKKSETKSKPKKSSGKPKTQKNALFNSSAVKEPNVFNGLDSDSSTYLVSKPKYKSIDAYMKKQPEGKAEDMVIDLGSDSD